MLDLEQCPFCNGKLEIVTLNCSSGGTPCYCFRCTKCGGIRRFGTLNPADICRECELPGKTRQLEEAIKDLIKAVNASNFCDTCSEEFGDLACSECPWHQAKIKAIRLLAKEESE